MNQDIEALIVLVLGIAFCLIIITIASNSNDRSTVIDQWIDEGAAVQNGLSLAGEVDQKITQFDKRLDI